MNEYDACKQYEKLTEKYEHARKCLREAVSMLRKSASSGEEYYFLPRCDMSDVASWCDAADFNLEDIRIDGE